jgi:pimeloyl-ACP methyl ester carboxylesterase
MLVDPGAYGRSPAESFTVVAPSLPGYGFSFRPNQRRCSIPEAADLLAKLMTEVLGYPLYGVQGGDLGALTNSCLGLAHPDRLIGMHVNMVYLPQGIAASDVSTAEEQAYFAERQHWDKEETGYSWIQGTKPQTLAYGLSDSPVGLAAWIVEKFRTLSDCGGRHRAPVHEG